MRARRWVRLRKFQHELKSAAAGTAGMTAAWQQLPKPDGCG